MASSSSTRPDPKQRPVPSPSNPNLLATQTQWLFTDEELTRTPSQLDGMKSEMEHISRSKGVNFIAQVGIMLKLPQLTLATAAVYMHRFFMRYSMIDLPQRPGMHPYPIAATSLFLATKTEENCRRMKEIVVSCCRVAQKQPNLIVDEQSKEFWKWRDTILHHEDVLLEALCFDLQLEQPYRILFDFICFFGVGEHKPLRNAAWAFVNDSMYTVLSLQFSARTVAAAALYAAARHCDVGFRDDDLGRPWWEQIDVDLPEVRRACTRIAQLYENNAMQKHSQYYPTTPLATSSDEGTEKTRIPYANVGSPVDSTPDVANANNVDSNNNSNNGRKRSREPEADARDRSESANPRDQGPVPLNGRDRSPKRQRTVEAEDAPGSQSQHSSSMTTSHTDRSSQDRYMNGHLAPPAPSHHSHTYQRQPPPHQEIDPVQQRIDSIIQQNLPSEQHPHPHHQQQQYADKYRGYSGDNSRRDRDYDYDRDRERDRDRRNSDRHYGGDWDLERDRRRVPSVENQRDYHHPQHQHQHQHQHQQSGSRGPQPQPQPQQHPSPPPPPQPPSEEKEEGEAEGSEEGEL